MEWTVDLAPNGDWRANHPSGKGYAKKSFEAATQCCHVGRKLDRLKIPDPDGAIASSLADDLVSRALWISRNFRKQRQTASKILKRVAKKHGRVPTATEALDALNAARIAAMDPPLKSIDDLERLYTTEESD